MYFELASLPGSETVALCCKYCRDAADLTDGWRGKKTLLNYICISKESVSLGVSCTPMD